MGIVIFVTSKAGLTKLACLSQGRSLKEGITIHTYIHTYIVSARSSISEHFLSEGVVVFWPSHLVA